MRTTTCRPRVSISDAARNRLRPRGAAVGTDRGVALILSLLLLGLMAILGLAMVWALSSDMLIDGYYRNFRGSFYAADSGLNIARQQLLNQVSAAFPSAWATPPLSNQTATATAALNYITSNYGNFASLNAGEAGSSWSESFEIVNVSNCTNSFAPAPSFPQVTSTNPSTGQATGYRYIFNYNLCSTGRSLAAQQVNISETGSMTINLTGQASSTTVSFSAFGGFVANYAACGHGSPGALVPGTMTGMMATNGQWQFFPGGPYIFTDLVEQANSNFGYWFSSGCINSPQPSYQSGGQTIAPTFQGSPSPGYELGQAPLAMPTNAFSQEWAVLDGTGCGEGSNVCGNINSPSPPVPTDVNLNSDLKNIAGTAYPVTGTTSGVYLNYSTTAGVDTMQGGGIYVEGNASVLLSTSGASAQIYTITQGSTSTTVTIDPLATPPPSWNCAAGTKGTTIVKSGSTVANICSVPTNYSLTPPQPETMLYVNGTITSLSGPGQGVGAIQNYNAVTITANGDIDLTGDVVYATEPVTTTQNQIVPGTNPACCAGTPVATLIPGNDYGQDLGLFTATGNINLQTSYSNQNLQVDGSQAAIGQNCATTSCGFTATGCINTFNNVGGQIQSNIFAACMNTENTYFDRRYTSKAGFAPPWFPSTTLTQGGAQPTNLNATVQRISWIASPQ